MNKRDAPYTFPIWLALLSDPAVVPAGKDVTVAGAGLGGLAFSLSLLKLCREQAIKPLPRITLFERDASAEARLGQGYFLSVRGDSNGLQVLSATSRKSPCQQLMLYRAK